MLEDIAILTGGQVISEDRHQARERDHRHAGTAKRVEITKENTTIVDVSGSKDDIEGRVNQIKAQIEEPRRTTTRKSFRNA